MAILAFTCFGLQVSRQAIRACAHLLRPCECWDFLLSASNYVTAWIWDLFSYELMVEYGGIFLLDTNGGETYVGNFGVMCGVAFVSFFCVVDCDDPRSVVPLWVRGGLRKRVCE